MSYSRWSYSRWYTYSDCSLVDDEATLTCWDRDSSEKFSWPLTVLVENKKSCLQSLCEKVHPSFQEAKEISKIIKWFVDDHRGDL